MNTHFFYTIVATLIGILFFALASFAARRGSVPGAKVLPVIMFSASGYAIAYLLQMSSPNLASAVFWYNVSVLAANLAAPAWFIFVLMWTGRLEKPAWQHYLLVGFIPILVCLAAWTNPLHQMYGTNFRFVAQHPWAVLEWDFGVWYWVGFYYAYALTAAMVVTLLYSSRSRLHLSPPQAWLFLAGVFVPALINILFNLGISPIPGLDTTPFSFMFTGVVWSLAFFRYGILDILPVAHERVFASMPVGMIVLDALGRVADINPAARQMLGTAGEIYKGKMLPVTLPEIFSGAGAEGQAEEIQDIICLNLKNGPRYLDVRLSPILGREKMRRGSLFLLDDITERKQAQDALREFENKLRSLFSAMNDVILTYDIQDGYLERAPTNLDIYKPLQDLLGKTFDELFPAETAAIFQEASLQALKLGKVNGLEYCMMKNGKERWFSANITAMSERTVLWVARDITDQKHIDQILRKNEMRLLQAQAIAHLGSWELDLATGLFWASDEALRIYGFEPGYTMSLEQVQKLRLPDERERLEKAFNDLLDGKGTYDQEYAILPEKSTVPRAVHVIANLIRDEQGRPLKTFGVIQDITARKLAEKVLRESEQRYRSVIQSATDAILTVDTSGRLISWNTGAKNIFSYEESEVLGQSLTMLMPENYRDAHSAGMAYILKGGEPRFMGQPIKVVGVRKNGEHFPMELVLSSWTEQGQIYVTGIIRDVTDRQLLEDSLQYQSNHDALTGLFNRQYYEAEIERLQHSRSFPITILMMDVDGLKRVNDQQGHNAGDDLLRRVAQVLKASFRPQDMIARIGGDEFVVILSGVDGQIAMQAVERLRSNLVEHNRTRAAHEALGLSIGMECGKEGSLLSEIFKQADQGMYRDKAEKKSHAA